MSTQKFELLSVLRLIAERTNRLRFSNLPRPHIPYDKPATDELVNWGVCVYCYSWLRHFSRLVNGIIVLKDAGNTPSAIIVARSAFELGAHAYYVNKHLTQHVDLMDLDAAWKFLGPVSSGSRYINKVHPQESDMFPESPHIHKVVNCFGEIQPGASEDYSFMSGYSHPNMFAFSQYGRWPNPFEIQFVDREPGGWLGSTAASCLSGLTQIEEMLRLARDGAVRPALVRLLKELAESAGGSVAGQR